MNEDTPIQTETTEGATAPKSQSYESVLREEGTASNDSPSVNRGEAQPTKTEQDQTSETTETKTVDDPEVELELGGETYRGRQSQFSRALKLLQSLGDDASSMFENAEKIAELKKNYDRDYTQKTQAIGGFRKSIESNFGRMPDENEFKALGQIWRSYFENPQAKQVIDALLSGELGSLASNEDSGTSDPNQRTADPYTKRLEQELYQVKNELRNFRSTLTSEKQAQLQREANQIWTGWVTEKSKTGAKITEDIESAMGPFIDALGKRYPDWGHNKILDEAYRYATIDQEQNRAIKKAFVTADKLKDQNPPKITPKTAKKPDRELSYSAILGGE